MIFNSSPIIARAFRRSGHFQVFYLTPMLYFAYFILLIFHAPDFWKWFVGPAGCLLQM
jgi:hypothetical protein